MVGINMVAIGVSLVGIVIFLPEKKKYLISILFAILFLCSLGGMINNVESDNRFKRIKEICKREKIVVGENAESYSKDGMIYYYDDINLIMKGFKP